MTDEEKTAYLRLLLQPPHSGEGCDCCAFTDIRLASLLAQAGGDVMKAAYLGALYMAEQSETLIPDGTRLTSNRKYWLTLAAVYRNKCSGVIPRADEEGC